MTGLRPYQAEAMKAIRHGFCKHEKQLVILPTGAGKTVLFSYMAKRFLDHRKERTLILAHREELLDQAADKIHRHTGIKAQVEQAGRRASLSAEVVVGSVQTLQRARLENWPRDHFGLVVVDECHHVAAASYRRTLAHFDATAKVLGVTATPGRADKQNLGIYFQNIAYEISLTTLIEQGYLCPIKVKTVPLKIDLSSVHSEKGDYDANELAAVIEPLLKSMVESIKEHASDRKILIFLPMRKTSRLMAQLLNEAGIKAEHVDGESEDRKAILDRFHHNQFQALCNASLLFEGYDQEDISCVVPARPTRSEGMYKQIVGRGTRTHASKKDLLLLDFLWLNERHNLMKPAHLIAKSDRHAALMMDSIGDEEIDLLDVAAEASNEMEAALVREAAEAQRKAQARESKPVNKKPLDLAQVAQALKLPGLVDFESDEDKEWHNEPLTDVQKTQLERQRIPLEAIKNRGHANAVLQVIYHRFENDLASFSQVVWLQKYGHADPANTSRGDAKLFLDAKWNKSTDKIKQAIETSRNFLASKRQNQEHVFASDVTK